MIGVVLAVAFCTGCLVQKGAAEAEADSPGPVLVTAICRPDTSSTSACVWTSDCPVGGCAERCILNEDTTESFTTVLDRSIGEEAYSGCPVVAYWVNYALSVVDATSSRRQLLSQENGDSWDMKDVAASLATVFAKPDNEFEQAMVQAKHRWRTEEAAKLRPDISQAADLRRLLDAESEAPASGSAPTSTFSSDIPSNPCITAEGFEAAEQVLLLMANAWKDVFTTAAAGEELTADQQTYGFILDRPNEFQFLISMFEEPGRVEDYMLNRCTNREMVTPDSLSYFYWLDPDERSRLSSADDLVMVQCVDNFGAFEEFERLDLQVSIDCFPPFDQSPNCYGGFGSWVISSEKCARAYASAYNITDLTPLYNVASITNAIHSACGAVTDEVTCATAKDPILQELEDIHSGMPVRHEIIIQETVVSGPVDAVGPLCFGSQCDTPAPAPSTVPVTADEPAAVPVTVAVTPAVEPEMQPTPDTGFDDPNPPIDALSAAGARLCGFGAAAAATLLAAGVGVLMHG